MLPKFISKHEVGPDKPLTCWLRTTSILVVIGRIYRHQFKDNYLKNLKLFVIFHCIFEMYIKLGTF